MKVLNFGSLNIDYVYKVDHMVREGETLASGGMEVYCGGKGLNQSVSLAKAGVNVYHAGMIGEEGGILLETCSNAGVDTGFVREVPERSGHTIIQVDDKGQNCILLYGGANHCITKEFVDEVMACFGKEDILLLQNEINMLDYIIERGFEQGMTIALNPSPYNGELKNCDFSKVSLFLVNEVEGEQITGQSEPEKILEVMKKRWPQAKTVLTLGGDGAVYQWKEEICRQEVYPVKAVDTTAAGDTFTGYFIASIIEGMEAEEGLRLAARAASIAVTRKGAAPSIPVRTEVN